MSDPTNSVLSSQTPNSPMFDKQPGNLLFAWVKWFQNITRIVNIAFNTNGQITTVVAPGFIIASTDNISDGAGSPLAGGKKAFLALVPGATGDVLTYNGTSYGPAPIPPPPAPPVTRILAGTGIAVSPGSGLGNVTVSSTAGAGYSLGGALTTANVVLGPGAGAGATLNAVVGLDGNHQIDITTGTGPAVNGIVFTVTFTTSRGHVTYPIVKNIVVSAGHSPFDVEPSAASSATTYQAFSGTGLDASTNYVWNISAP